MWTSRQMQIVEILLNNTTGINGTVIGDRLSVSDRTIRNDICLINKTLKSYDCRILSNNKSGYYLKGENITVIASLLEKHKNMQDIGEVRDRQLTMIGKLIFDDEKSLEDLSNTLYVSQQTVYRDLSSQGKLFKERIGCDFITIHSDMVFINDSEEVIRKVFLLVLQDETVKSNNVYNSKVIYLFSSYYDTDEFKNLFSKIKLKFESKNIVPSDDTLFFVVWSVYFSVVRNKKGHHIEENNEISRADRKIIDVLIELENEMENFYMCDINFLNNFMWTLKLFEHNQSNSDISSTCLKVLEDFYSDVIHKYGFDLRDSNELMNSLMTHVDYMLRRLQEGYEYDNPEKNRIKEKYAFAYEIAMLIVPIVFHHQNKYLLDGEVSYIALYIAYHLEKMTHCVHAVIVSREYSGMTKLVINWLTQNFNDRIEILDVIPTHKLNEYQDQRPADLIISLAGIIQTRGVPLYVVDGLPEAEDRSKLMELLNHINVGNKYETAVRNKFSSKLVKIYEKSLPFEQIIHELSMKLYDNGNIEDSGIFVTDVVNREINYPTFLSNWFMIPHPLSVFAKKSGVAVAVLKTPVKYNYKEIRLIFLLATEARNDPEINYLFQLFKQIAHSKGMFEKLTCCGNEKDFITVISQLAGSNYRNM